MNTFFEFLADFFEIEPAGIKYYSRPNLIMEFFHTLLIRAMPVWLWWATVVMMTVVGLFIGWWLVILSAGIGFLLGNSPRDRVSPFTRHEERFWYNRF